MADQRLLFSSEEIGRDAEEAVRALSAAGREVPDDLLREALSEEQFEALQSEEPGWALAAIGPGVLEGSRERGEDPQSALLDWAGLDEETYGRLDSDKKRRLRQRFRYATNESERERQKRAVREARSRSSE